MELPVRAHPAWNRRPFAAMIASIGLLTAVALLDGLPLSLRIGAAVVPIIATLAMWVRTASIDARNIADRNAFESRSSTLDRLLEFSQTIQGAGKADQVYAAMQHYLPQEFGLSGLVILNVQPDAIPAMTIKASWPSDVVRTDVSVAEFDSALCPCIRQNQPRCFKGDSAPVRCVIDRTLSLPSTQPAFCIPFNIGRSSQVLVHMTLPSDQEWTDDTKQLAQTYVNAANSTLITLHHLEQADKQSMTDPLTGMYNRRSMDTLLTREIALADRHGQPFSLVIIDMDKFKQVNDTHGHAAGDHLLRAFANCVQMTLRKTDLAFRYGGDEFVVGLSQCTTSQALIVMEKLRQALAAADFSDAIAHLEAQPTLSIGVASRSVEMNLRDLPALMNAADTALYEAKAANRNCVKTYEPKVAA